MPQNWNNLIMFTFCSQKQITREVKIPLQISGGLDHILLRKYYRTTIIWYAKLAPINRNFCTEWGYVNSHPANQYLTYQSHQANGNQTRKSSLSMMIYTPEHGSVNTTSQYSTVIATIWYHPIHPKSQYDRGTSWWNEEHSRNDTGELLRYSPPRSWNRRRNGYGSPHAAWCGQ